jgi:hypothetical protein
LLHCEHDGGIYTEEPEGSYEVYYEESGLSGGVKGVDYGIVYGAEEAETEQ